jgi:hypothetical protein
MDTNEKQIALSVLENLRADLMCAHLKNESRELDVADLLQYIYSVTGSIKAFGMSDLYGNDTGYGPDISKSNGHNGKAHFIRKDLARSLGIKTCRPRF